MKCGVSFTAIVSLLLTFAIVPSLASPVHSLNEQYASDFNLVDLQNTSHSLSDYNGSIVVLDFFSVKCANCAIDARTVLVPLYQNYSNNDSKVQFLSIETSGASPDTINSTYLNSTAQNSTGITWPILVGGNTLENWPSANGTVYVVDPAGKIVATMTHPLDYNMLKATLENLLAVNLDDASDATRDDPTRNAHSNTSKSNDSAASTSQLSTPVVTSTSSDPQGSESSAATEICPPIVPVSIAAQITAITEEAAALAGSAASCCVPTICCVGTTIPTVTLPVQSNCATNVTVPSVFEFSLLGLGAPTLLIGVLYLLLRRV